ncbi:MAG: hypothetical protein ABW157_13525 [Candidatus Thiodiazotropha sp. LLP2]
MNKTAFLFLLLLFGTTTAGAKDGRAHITNYKHTGDNVHGVIYRIHTPQMHLHNLWLRVDLKTAVFGNKNKSIADPEQTICRLIINREATPAIEYAQYLGGSLYFYFDKLEEFSEIEFTIAWRNPADAEGPVPEHAALEFKSDEWEKTAAWEPALPRLFPIVREAQITIRDGLSCDLY